MSNQNGNAGSANTPAKQAAAKKAAGKPASAKTDPKNKAEGNAEQNKSEGKAAEGGAGGTIGKFVCTRNMTGDKYYRAGDKRELRIGQALHLLKSGALKPADKATLDIAKKLKPDLDIEIYKAPAKKKD